MIAFFRPREWKAYRSKKSRGITGIDGELHDPEDQFDAVELIWDTGAHGTVVSEDLLSSEFRNYLVQIAIGPMRLRYLCSSETARELDKITGYQQRKAIFCLSTG